MNSDSRIKTRTGQDMKGSIIAKSSREKEVLKES